MVDSRESAWNGATEEKKDTDKPVKSVWISRIMLLVRNGEWKNK